MRKLGKWNRNQLIDTNAYIRLFLEAVNQHLDAEEKRTLFMISRYYTFGAASVGERNYNLALHYFDKGEAYFNAIDPEKVLLRELLLNIFNRSKSFYFHRLERFDEAIGLVENTLKANRELEAKGLTFLLFDRIQQYQNYAKVLFSRGELEQGLTMLSGLIVYLMNRDSSILPDLADNHLETYEPVHWELRTQLLKDILPDSVQQLLVKHPDTEASTFFDPVFQAIDGFTIKSNQDEFLRRWLLVLQVFKEGKEPQFLAAADEYRFNIPSFAKDQPHRILNALVERVKNTETISV